MDSEGRQPSGGDRDAAEMPGGASTRIVIVDDHGLVREGTVQLLQREPGLEVVGEAATGEEGLALLERLRPDVALVDVSLPEMSGLDVAREAARRGLGVRVLIVSAYDDYAYVVEALEVGVSGYLLKTASAKELVDAVRAVAHKMFVLDSSVSARLARRWRAGPVAPQPAGALTARETDVLCLLARGLSNKQIAVQLELGVRTIEGHVSSVLSKLGVASRTEAALYALNNHLVSTEVHGGPARQG